MQGLERLLSGFAEAVDTRHADRAAASFTADGVFDPRGEPIVGRQAIRAMYDARMADERRKTRHVWSNVRTVATGQGQASFRATLTIYAFEPQVSETALQLRVLDVEGLCTQDEEGEWLFERQVARPAFKVELPLDAA